MKFIKNAISALKWRADERRLPGEIEALPRRAKPLHVNFSFHAENLGNERCWRNFLDFAATFHDRTGVKAIACVLPAINPLAAAQMDRDNVTHQEYAARVHELRQFCEIGYHGHFFTKADTPADARAVYDEYLGGADVFPYDVLSERSLAPVGGPNEDTHAVNVQVAEELDWFARLGIRPRIYAAGMWFLSNNVIRLIEEAGFQVDTSIRQRHSHRMGRCDLHADDLPGRGVAFLIPPRRLIIEIQSVFYPIKHPLLQLDFLSEILARNPDEDAFIVLPSHETEVLHFRKQLERYVDFIQNEVEGAVWSSLDDMLSRISL